MTRFLPASLLAFVPVNLWYQVSGLAGWSLELPTIGQTISLVVLCCMFMIAVSARIAGEEAVTRERLEARLRDQNDELEASEEKARSAEQLASIGTLAAGILHQINNPIGSILAVTQLELSHMPAFANAEETTTHLRMIESEAIRCGQIVRNILLIARGHPSRVERHDLNLIAESAISSTRLHALHQEAQVKWYAASESLPIDANDVEIEEALINLITNAIESKPGAQVVVRANRDGNEAVCSVQDDGPGVLAEAREHLFDPFYSTKTEHGGNGLGLSVAHGILTGHGGDVELVESAPGSGSCFRIRLPLSLDPSTDPIREPL